MSLTKELFGSSSSSSAALEQQQKPSSSSRQPSSGDAGTPAVSFEATNKATFDIFAVAPQVKKASRKEKHKMLLETNSTRAAAGFISTLKSDKKTGVTEKQGASKVQSLLPTVFIDDTVGDGKGENAQKPTKSGRRKHLRHGLNTNEEEEIRTVFVGNLINNVKRRDVEHIFKKCGSIESVRVRGQALEEEQDKRNVGRAIRVLRGDVKKDERFSAVAYVLFKEKKSVAEAIQMNGIVVNGRHIVVTSMDPESKAYAPETSVFIGNIAYDTNEEMVWSFFTDKSVSDVRRVRLVRDRDTGACKGFGYVEFQSPSSVAKAIATRGSLLNGREVRIVHVQRSKEVVAAKATRREKRRRDGAEDASDGKKKKKTRMTTTTTTTKKTTAERRQMPNGEAVPSWMGVMTNPRRKIPKDIRPLVEGKSARPRAGPRAPVKRKVRNPEK